MRVRMVSGELPTVAVLSDCRWERSRGESESQNTFGSAPESCCALKFMPGGLPKIELVSHSAFGSAPDDRIGSKFLTW